MYVLSIFGTEVLWSKRRFEIAVFQQISARDLFIIKVGRSWQIRRKMAAPVTVRELRYSLKRETTRAKRSSESALAESNDIFPRTSLEDERNMPVKGT